MSGTVLKATPSPQKADCPGGQGLAHSWIPGALLASGTQEELQKEGLVSAFRASG